MLYSSAFVWPSSVDEVREALQISSATPLLCISKTKLGVRCIKGISEADRIKIERLLLAVVAAGSWGAAEALLKDLSKLVVCKRSHREDSVMVLWKWTFIFRAAKVHSEGELEAQEQPTPPRTPGKPTSRDRVGKCIKFEPASPISDTEEDDTQLDYATHEMVDKRVREPAELSLSALSLSDTPSAPKVTQLENSSRNKIFKPYSEPWDQYQINNAVKDRIRKPLTESEIKTREKNGSVYVYKTDDSVLDSDPYLKIGFAKVVSKRLSDWEKSCGYKTDICGEMKVKLFRRVEGLVHAQLRASRLIEESCPTCETMHTEWFETHMCHAMSAIGLWVGWMRLEPYNEYGMLKEVWQRKLQEVDLDDPSCWMDFVILHPKEGTRR
ncbi:hypothetical protein PWT90_07992 [Aphanocladium album]|nr:hypothetical protein PWT90_07992 [Aphanocladium album]